ncbi:membrane protein [hydrocarbon metagenome]|uniref:Membrane protein n=1 Tax=hydrocarbon metagenome TaxID=938273 RepID=A0A0W8FLR6_9ZZZZ
MVINNTNRLNILIQILLGMAIFSIFVTLIILSLLPPIATDALIHHLAIPKLWLLHGGLYEIKWSVFSYYPMNVDLLYLIPLYFHNDIIPNFIHMGFGIGTSWLIFCYLNNKFGRTWGLLGILVFLSTPMVMRMSTVAYVDLGLIFFTSAGIFAYSRWRNNGYSENKWLLISSITMGIALGTKYNALIAWFLLLSAIIFFYSRDKKTQWPAVRYGAIFFLISLLIFSPWLIKNLILTGNPLFPLFNGFFNVSTANITNEETTYNIVSGNTYMGMFKYRAIIYGESFWQTLIIPLRFFFQGQDYSDQYFDGVLNPLLIIMVPFAFMNKSFQKDKIFFVVFSVFFILITFFLDELRVRYILPTIPFLCVLTVMGIKNILTWSEETAKPLRYFYTAAILLFLVILGFKNVMYLNNYFQSLQPVKYLCNMETRDEYLNRHTGSYAAISYINKNTPQNAKVRLIFLAGRGYYLDRIYEDDSSFGMNVIRDLVAHSSEDETFQKHIRSLGYTHLLVRKKLFLKYLHDNYSPEKINILLQQMSRATEMIYEANGYAVYEIITQN